MDDPRAEMVTVYAGEQPPDWWDAAVFLAGPTPRSPAVASWRPDALGLLERLWTGPGRLVVFVPERPEGGMPHGWLRQVEWEDTCLHLSDVVAFWVPRDLATLPGFTTNVEWGRWEGSGRVVLGAPADAPGMRYLAHYATQHGAPVADTLEGTLAAALTLTAGTAHPTGTAHRPAADPRTNAHRPTNADRPTGGARRAGAHRELPLPLWRNPGVQAWLGTQEAAGHRLRSARVAWTWPGPDGRPFWWAAHVAVEVSGEGRVKDNEVVIGRPDVSAVVAYRPGAALADTLVVLVREYRSSAVTGDGRVHELPGGSQPGAADPRQTALEELAEETGLRVDAARLRAHGVRQPAATVSAHRVHLFSLELTEAEVAALEDGPQEHGLAADGERTTLELTTYGTLLTDPDVDWSTLGLVTAALAAPA